jgi:hypothetical protein
MNFDRRADRLKIEHFQAATPGPSLKATHGVGAPKRFLDLV